MASSLSKRRAFSEWFWGISDKLGKGTFAHYLHLRPTPKFEETTSEQVFTVKFMVPESLCQKHHNTKKPIFPLSSILAVFDEVSTDGFVLSDKNRRPGVSITLTGESIREVYAGEKVQVRTTINKIGKTIGFVDIEMFIDDKQNPEEVVARGSHVKFLPMPLMWNTLFGKFFFLTRPVIDFLFKFHKAPEVKMNPEVRIFDIFEFKEKVELQDESKNGKTDQSRASIEFSVKRDLCNPMGSLHGGACCVAAEEAAFRSLRHLNDFSHPLTAKFMHVTFLTGVQKGKVVADAVTESKSGISSFVQLSKNGKQLTTARIIWKI